MRRSLLAFVGAVVGAAVWASVLCVAAPGPAAGAAATVKVPTPLVRVGDGTGTALGSIVVQTKGAGASFVVSVAKVPASAPLPLGVFLEDGPGAGTFTEVGEIPALKHGKGKLTLTSPSGVPAALGVGDVNALVGRSVEVRDASSAVHLAGKIPPIEKFVGTKTTAKFAAAPGSPLPKASAQFNGVPSSGKGSEKFLLKARGLAKGAVYTLWIEDAPGSGNLVLAGTLEKGAFQRDTAKGQSLPLAVGALADLIDRTFEVRDATDTPVVQGRFPRLVFVTTGFPRSEVLVFDLDGNTDRYLRYVPGIVVYRTEYDSKQVSRAVLRASSDALWRITAVGSLHGDPIVNVRLASNDRYWWGVGSTGNQHYLTILNTSTEPSNADQARFVLRSQPKIHGRTTWLFESVLYPDEFIVNDGHGLSANGVLLSKVEQPQPISYR